MQTQHKTVKLHKNGKSYCTDVFLHQTPDYRARLEIRLPDGSLTVEANDFFDCLCAVKDKHPDILIYCKGYKINVHPSAMARQMSLGLAAYELTLGKRAESCDLVKIFDFEDQNLTTSNQAQKDFFQKWRNSFSA